LLFLALLAPDAFIARVWLGHDRGIVLLAFAATFIMTQIWGAVGQMGEALRKTVVVQMAGAAQALIHTALIAFLAATGRLNVPVIMVILAGEYLAIAWLLAPGFVRKNMQQQARDSAPGDLAEF